MGPVEDFLILSSQNYELIYPRALKRHTKNILQKICNATETTFCIENAKIFYAQSKFYKTINNTYTKILQEKEKIMVMLLKFAAKGNYSANDKNFAPKAENICFAEKNLQNIRK